MVVGHQYMECKSICTVLLFLNWKPEFPLKIFWLEAWLQETRKARKEHTHTQIKTGVTTTPHSDLIDDDDDDDDDDEELRHL